MNFLQQYDRLFLLTLGLVALLRGLGGMATFASVVLDPSTSGSSSAAERSAVLGSLAILHAAVQIASGMGLLLRRPFGWKYAIAFQAYELGKLAGALLITLLVGATTQTIQAGTDVLVQMTWALFSLLVFLMEPIARLCRIEGNILRVAAIWIVLGVVLALIKLASVL